jgi:D-alanyl-D-alanine carboxypeptidase
MLVFVLQRKHYGVAKALIAKGNGRPDDVLEAVGRTGQVDLIQAALDKGKPGQPALDRAYESALDRKQDAIAELLKKAGAQPPAPAVQVDAKVLDSYAGAYKSEQFPLEMKVFAKEGKLYLQAAGQPEFGPKAKSSTSFEFAPARIEIEFDSPGAFTLKQSGTIMKFKKVVTP